MLLADFATFQSKMAVQTANNIMIVNEIGNDLAQSGASESTARDDMRALIAMGRANGWRVLFATTTPRTVPTKFTADQQTAADNINDFFRNNPAESDGLIDWAAAPELSDPTDTTYYQDGVHPTAAGAAVIAELTETAVLGL